MSELMPQFHFLRPAWLLGLPLLAVLAWRWRRRWRGNPWAGVIDPELLPHLVDAPASARSRFSAWLFLLGATLSLLALAGPAWQQLPQPVFSSPAHRVLVMDLSEPMNAGDLKPSRLQRARLMAHQLLEHDIEGETALVAFAGEAFPVVPLTRDDGTLRHLLDSLRTDLMPRQGQNLAAGIREAMQLLDNAAAQRADIILLTVSPVDQAASQAVDAARDAGYRVHVLASGTPDGAPVPARDGGWQKDADGGIRLSRVETADLRRLAASGGGRYARIDRTGPDWQIAASRDWQARAEEQAEELTADLWRDEGPWLLLPVLLIAALGFRRGWLMLALVTLPALTPTPAQADWWRNDDQQGHALLQQGEAEAAAQVFDSRPWRAAALHRAGEHAAAAELWAQGDSAEDAYNRGNALARAGELQAALDAYDTALQRRPEFPAARDNRDLVEKLLEKQQQDQQQQQQSGEQNPQDQDQPQDSQGDEQQSQQNEQGQQSGEQNAEDAQSEPSQQKAEQQDEAVDDREESEQASQPGEEDGEEPQAQAQPTDPSQPSPDEQTQAVRQWLNRIPDDPGRLLREKFRRMQQRRASDGEDEETW